MISWKRIAFAFVMSLAVVALMIGASACGGKKADTPSDNPPADDAQTQAIQEQMKQAPTGGGGGDRPQRESKRERRDREREERR